MTMTGEVLLGPERRRRFSTEEKMRLLEEAGRPGSSVSLVARRNGLHPSVLFRWRKELMGREVSAAAPAMLLPVEVASEPPPAPVRSPGRPGRRGGTIEIELAGGERLRVGRDVDAEALRVVLTVLERR